MINLYSREITFQPDEDFFVTTEAADQAKEANDLSKFTQEEVEATIQKRLEQQNRKKRSYIKKNSMNFDPKNDDDEDSAFDLNQSEIKVEFTG